MAFWPSWLSGLRPAPRAAVQPDGGGTLVRTPAELERVMRGGATSRAGVAVTPETAMRVAAVYACVRIISGSVATLPLDVKRRLDGGRREDASDTDLWRLIRRRPNRWQKPAQFRRMLQAHVLLRGNAYCHIVRSRGMIIELIPLHPDRVRPKQGPDLSMTYEYRRPDGGTTVFAAREVLHLFGLTLDGIVGVTPIAYARETIGLALAMEDHGAVTFAKGLRVGDVLEHPSRLSPEGQKNLKASLDAYRAGGENEGGTLILEEGVKPSQIAMTAQDAQWLDARKFSRTDIAMFFGVPPFMIGDTEKSTSWGSGIEQQKDGYVTFTLDDHLTMWEEAVTVDLSDDPAIYAKFNRNALVKGNLKDRWAAYTQGLQWGVWSPDEVRALEDENPRTDGQGGVYYPPPNTAGGTTTTGDNSDVAPQPA